jgi:hypothetical protein
MSITKLIAMVLIAIALFIIIKFLISILFWLIVPGFLLGVGVMVLIYHKFK